MATAPVAEADTSTREKILVAALEIFAERGFDGAKTRDIAERAGANLGLIKYYFDTKEKLWRAAVDRAFAELRSAFEDPDSVDADVSERDKLAHLIRRFVRFVGGNPHFIRMMNDEGKRPGPRMKWLVKTHTGPLYRGLELRFQHAREQGLLPADIPATSMHYIVAGAAGLIFSQAPECEALSGIDPTTPKAIEAHADALITLLLGPR